VITLQFSYQDKILSRMIRWITWSEYSHVDFVMPNGQLLGARADGVRIRRPEGRYHFIRAEIDAPDSVLDSALSQVGKPYDFTAIIGFLFRRNWQRQDAWYCAELVSWAFCESGVTLLTCSDHHRITPRDILLSPLVRRTI
jgi:uncharacterized protein YycO